MQVEIIPFKSGYSKKFYDLNIEWLKNYFYVEPYDEKVLSNPEKYIIKKGGHVFFARVNTGIVGTVALMAMADKNSFELTKMAVSPEYRGQNIGQKLMQYCIDFANIHNFKSLIIYSSRKLDNAIYIYKKYGFTEIPVEPECNYERCDIKMKLKI